MFSKNGAYSQDHCEPESLDDVTDGIDRYWRQRQFMRQIHLRFESISILLGFDCRSTAVRQRSLDHSDVTHQCHRRHANRSHADRYIYFGPSADSHNERRRTVELQSNGSRTVIESKSNRSFVTSALRKTAELRWRRRAVFTSCWQVRETGDIWRHVHARTRGSPAVEYSRFCI